MRRLVVLGMVLALAGCGNRGQKSADDAKGDVTKIIELVDKDVAEIERGMPDGAKKFAEILNKEIKDGDPKANVHAVRSALLKMRQQVPDLGIAKSTFFAFTDDKGVAIRNDFEKDTMAGKDLLGGYPGLKLVIDGAPYASTTGQFGTPNPSGPDREWVAAVPVKKADDSKLGFLVTGWTYRRFAYHLQVTIQREVQDQLVRAGDKGKMPILYVCLFDKEHVYGAAAPGSPPVPPTDEKALETVDLVGKTAAGPTGAPLKIADRDFGWAAARLPKLGTELGVVVLRSEI